MALQRIVRHYAGDDDSDGNYIETSNDILGLSDKIRSVDIDDLSSVELDLLISSSQDCDDLIKLINVIKLICF